LALPDLPGSMDRMARDARRQEGSRGDHAGSHPDLGGSRGVTSGFRNYSGTSGVRPYDKLSRRHEVRRSFSLCESGLPPRSGLCIDYRRFPIDYLLGIRVHPRSSAVASPSLVIRGSWPVVRRYALTGTLQTAFAVLQSLRTLFFMLDFRSYSTQVVENKGIMSRAKTPRSQRGTVLLSCLLGVPCVLAREWVLVAAGGRDGSFVVSWIGRAVCGAHPTADACLRDPPRPLRFVWAS
jgi:hypothetical protein